MEMVELYQELEKATGARWKSMFYDGNPCFMLTIIFVHKIIVMIWARHFSGFMSTHQLQKIVVKRFLHWKCIEKIQSSIILS